ncbi:hypothetical protein [Hyphococcus sp.]|uniref:hypothetical protein n=1 Tax=Hyphococcus sp. TaxID=2038636 RepID=UPI003CCBEFB3
MWMLLLAALLSSSKSEIPPDIWACKNEVEIWCSTEGCSAKPTDEMTPMSVTAARNGAFSVCAYTGCWEGEAEVKEASGRLLWVANDVPFSTRPDGFRADVSLLIIENDIAGFIRVGSIATPLLCVRRPVDQ